MMHILLDVFLGVGGLAFAWRGCGSLAAIICGGRKGSCSFISVACGTMKCGGDIGWNGFVAG